MDTKKAKQWMIKNYPKAESELEWGEDVDDEVVLDAMVEYASEVSRKTAIDFLKWILDKDQIMLIGRTSDKTLDVTGIKELYDEWVKEVKESKTPPVEQ